MFAEKAGISYGEDALSTRYSADSHTDSTAASGTSLATTSSTSSTSSSRARRSGGILSFLKLRWLGFGATEEKQQNSTETVNEIMDCFRNNDVDGMKKFLEDTDVVTSTEDSLWWDGKELSAPKPILKPTPHPKKVFPKHLRKAVRFDQDCTPEEKQARPFTPLFTSTPKSAADVLADSDEEDLPPLQNCDSNTVLPPISALHNMSCSFVESLHKSRQQTQDALYRSTDNDTARTYYKVCYDDTDEEEVIEEDNKAEELKPTPSRSTFVVDDKCAESLNRTASIHEQSFELDTSTDSSIVLGLDRIEDYIRSLEDEITAANRFAREKDVIRARGAVRHAQVLQERIALMSGVINEMCGKFAHNATVSSDDFAADGDHKDISAAFEDSCWAVQLNFEDGSFDAQQL